MRIRISAIHRPEKIAVQRERAPAIILNAVWLTEPPTGTPWHRPTARLANPCAVKSREALLGRPSELGTLWLTPAPWTRITAPIAKAAESRSRESSDSDGSCGSGKPRGI